MGVLLLFIAAAGILRILGEGHVTPFSNISPIGAMALFSGAYFSNSWKSYLFPLLTLFISDVVVQQLFYPEFANGGLLYQGWAWTYCGFAAMVLAGQLIIKKSEHREYRGSGSGRCICTLADYRFRRMACRLYRPCHR